MSADSRAADLVIAEAVRDLGCNSSEETIHALATLLVEARKQRDGFRGLLRESDARYRELKDAANNLLANLKAAEAAHVG